MLKFGFFYLSFFRLGGVSLQFSPELGQEQSLRQHVGQAESLRHSYQHLLKRHGNG